MKPTLRILDKPEEMVAVEELQRLVWSGNETEIVPVHVLIAAAHNGGLLIGAYDEVDGRPELVGFVFSFPGLYETPDELRPKQHSHMLAVRPGYRNDGLGFALKRAQWQMVRHQHLDRITWTYDPLLSHNANLNIAKLGAVCNTYLRDIYGEMRDDMNVGVPSDRFQVDWWVNSQRVNRRLSRRKRGALELSQYLAAGAPVVNPAQMGPAGWLRPAETLQLPEGFATAQAGLEDDFPLLVVEIPADYLALKAADRALALEWRRHTRSLFEDLFERGYLVTDFVRLAEPTARSFYILSYGESTL